MSRRCGATITLVDKTERKFTAGVPTGRRPASSQETTSSLSVPNVSVNLKSGSYQVPSDWNQIIFTTPIFQSITECNDGISKVLYANVQLSRKS